MFLTLSSCAKLADSTSVSVASVMWTYKSHMNSALGEGWKEPSSSKILAYSSFNGDSNEETLNLNLLAITENKRNIKYIKILPTSTEGATKNIGEVLH